jgi:chromosome segregation ATPase
MNDDDIDNLKMEEMNVSKKNMPVKTHIRKMEETIAELRNDLNNNLKNGQLLRAENAGLQSKTQEKCNEITKCIMDDLYNFEKDFSRIKQNDKTETAFFDQQIKSLQQDAVKLKSNVIQLDSRLRSCENDIGVDYK